MAEVNMESPMHSSADITREVRKRIKQHQRKIVCRALMWEGIRTALKNEIVDAVLNNLNAEEQAYLRQVYDDWPPSLWAGSQPEEHPLNTTIEAWCRQE